MADAKESGSQISAKELEINLLGLFQRLKKRKVILMAMVMVGVAGGYAVFKTLPKRFEAGVTFAFASQGGANSRLQQFAALAGNFNSRQDGTSPYVTNLRTFAKTREVTGRLRNLVFGDSTLEQIMLPGRAAGMKDTLDGFHFSILSKYDLIKKEDVYVLSGKSRDPKLSRFLAQNIFDTISRLLEEKRREFLKKKLSFIDTLVNEYRWQYEATSNRKKRFLMENLDVTSPELVQKREQIFLQLRLDEEKYLLSTKEKEELRIQYQQSEEPLVMIEEAYVPSGPVFPSRTKCVVAGAALALLLYILIVGYADRSLWIGIR